MILFSIPLPLAAAPPGNMPQMSGNQQQGSELTHPGEGQLPDGMETAARRRRGPAGPPVTFRTLHLMPGRLITDPKLAGAAAANQ